MILERMIVKMNKGVNPGQLIRLLGAMNPILGIMQTLKQPLGYKTTIVEDPKNDRWVVILKCAYKTKLECEEFVKVDAMIDKI